MCLAEPKSFRTGPKTSRDLAPGFAQRKKEIARTASVAIHCWALFIPAALPSQGAIDAGKAPAPRNEFSPSPPPAAERVLGPGSHFSRELESTLHRALAGANHREHAYATLEHLLLTLIDDQDASAVMKACNVGLGALKKNLANYIDNELAGLAKSDGNDARPTSAFQRVVQRAVTHIQ